jgi:hypothetical protein
MPSLQRLFKYGVRIGESTHECVQAVIQTSSRRTRWYAMTEAERLEEEVARELFPSVGGTYYVPAFVLKTEDQPDINA